MTNRESFRLMSKEEKIKRVDLLRINHPDFKRGLELIAKCHHGKLKSSGPQCMLVTGNYGSGKTAMAESYIKMYQKRIRLEKTTKVAILHGEIPSPTKISDFLEAMLDHLGDSSPVRGTVGNKKHRLIRLIKDCEVELILLDEFQHFYHKENQKVNHDVADCFKSIINKTKVPVVMLGLDEAELVLEANGQLKRRFSFKHHINGFKCKDTESTDRFRILLHQIDKSLPFMELGGFKEPDMWEKFESATEGNMNALMKLIRTAAEEAIETGDEQIKDSHLANSFELHQFILNGKNPFR